MDNNLDTISNLFEGNEIRSIWDSEKQEYYFSVVDIIRALTDSKEPRKYWSVLKNRLKKEGSDIAQTEHPEGLKENLKVAARGGSVAKGARDLYEKETKRKAISDKNVLNYKYIDEVKKIESKVGENNE